MARSAYCTGCGVIYGKMHYLIEHRRFDRCGGRFLSSEEIELWTKVRKYMHLVEFAKLRIIREQAQTQVIILMEDIRKLQVVKEKTNRWVPNLEPKPVKHRARKPGTIRKSRLPGGSGFRNNWERPLP